MKRRARPVVSYAINKLKPYMETPKGKNIQRMLLNEAIKAKLEVKNSNEPNVKNLKYKLDYISEVFIQEKEQCMKVLKKCNPWMLTTCQCLICGEKMNHSDDCEYVRLTGGHKK